MHADNGMELLDKLSVLADAAKYDAACTSSGAKRGFQSGKIGCTSSGVMGCCHSFSADGRCITLLKVLLSNDCMYDCKYCVNRRTNETHRATFTPEELADLTIQFYRRNYIEGLFLSSGVLRSPDYTTELMIRALSILRREYRFNGYIHAKAIPGASPELVEQLGMLADRLSVNIELPSEASLRALAPNKTRAAVLRPMRFIADRGQENRRELVKYRHAPRFAPAGQATQMIVGASPESDGQIIRLSQALYKKYTLKRVYFSSYVPANYSNSALPVLPVGLLREHRLYQADWLMRFYGFSAEEILDENENLSEEFDPKCGWALRHPEFFPVEINTAPPEILLRVPGIGFKSAYKIVQARKFCRLDFLSLAKMRVVLKRAKSFITCSGKFFGTDNPSLIRKSLLLENTAEPQQLSLFSTDEISTSIISGQL